ncbi:tetratricopeptide repeat protein [Saccharobesus litoralis]|nr:hypothetical protein [Saccharobesus litoralis]
MGSTLRQLMHASHTFKVLSFAMFYYSGKSAMLLLATILVLGVCGAVQANDISSTAKTESGSLSNSSNNTVFGGDGERKIIINTQPAPAPKPRKPASAKQAAEQEAALGLTNNYRRSRDNSTANGQAKNTAGINTRFRAKDVAQAPTLTDLIENSQQQTKTDLHDKAYRSALFHYFQGDNSVALSQLNHDKIRLGYLNEKASLFEAGLQVSLGLQYEAQRALIRFVMQTELDDKYDYRKTAKIASQQEVHAAQKKLLLIALLQLAEQKLNQAQYQHAQQALQKISQVPVEYYNQYHVLSQLAYWPHQPPLVNLSAEDRQRYQPTPYIALNRALRLMNNQEYTDAISQLNKVLQFQFANSKVDSSFWQALFATDSVEGSANSKLGNNRVSNARGAVYHVTSNQDLQALKDYANLLLANVYLMQGNTSQAYQVLGAFPQHSPFTESALYLFSVTAQKNGQTYTAHQVWQTLVELYPYHLLAWQAALQHAELLVKEEKLPESLAYYQFSEQLFIQRLEELRQFEAEYLASQDLLAFYAKPQAEIDEHSLNLELTTQQTYETNSIWLGQMLADQELDRWYQDLIDLDLITRQLLKQKQKINWIGNTLALNQSRIENINQAHASYPPPQQLADLIVQRDQLANRLANDVEQQHLLSFATKQEKAWLQRIEKSEKRIAFLGAHRDMADYQARLKRLRSVIQWRIKQDLPARLWQLKKQLNTIDQGLSIATGQVRQLDEVTRQNERLADLSQRHVEAEQKVSDLLAQLAKVRVTTTDNIRQRVAQKVAATRTDLQRMQLIARRAMAKILETMQMSNNDNAISQPDVSTVKSQYRSHAILPAQPQVVGASNG